MNLVAADPEVGSTFLSMNRGVESHGLVLMEFETPHWLMAFHQIDGLNLATPTRTPKPKPFELFASANNENFAIVEYGRAAGGIQKDRPRKNSQSLLREDPLPYLFE